jgi:hypothetical protein
VPRYICDLLFIIYSFVVNTVIISVLKSYGKIYTPIIPENESLA